MNKKIAVLHSYEYNGTCSNDLCELLIRPCKQSLTFAEIFYFFICTVFWQFLTVLLGEMTHQQSLLSVMPITIINLVTIQDKKQNKCKINKKKEVQLLLKGNTGWKS